jgi:hypothetical protein
MRWVRLPWQVEEQALDRDRGMSLEDADQQGWEGDAAQGRAPSGRQMEAHIGRQEGDAANVAEVALRQRARDRRSLAPKALKRRRPIIGRTGKARWPSTGWPSTSRIARITSLPSQPAKQWTRIDCRPCRIDRLVRAILMGRTWHQRVAVIPAPAEAFHNGERLSRGLIAHGKQS